MLIYKVLRAEEWSAFKRDGRSDGVPVDVADGYVHFSTATQPPETLRRHFAGEAALMLLALDADALGADLRWEPARDSLLPHLYRELRRNDLLWARPLPDAAGLAALE